MRKTMLILFVAAFSMVGVVAAQTVSVTLSPTTGGGGQYKIGADSAALTQTVNVNIPVEYGLAIDDAMNLNFDLSAIANQKGQIVCVSGVPGEGGVIGDVTQPNGGVWPLGTHYQVGETLGAVQVIGGEVINQYPPVAINQTTGAVDVASKGDFVCYRSFVLEKFANTKGWDVTVTRNDVQTELNSTPMFVQDNICADPGANTGLFPLVSGATATDLFAGGALADYQNETTGAAAAAAGPICGNPTSWLNDLVVVAIEVDGNTAGTWQSNLTYTIMALAQ